MSESPATFDHEAALAACARGERYALRAIYEREGSWLLGVVLRIVRQRETAEDVLQEAMLQIWRAAGTFDPARGSGRGWIYTVVRHRALQEVRRRSTDPTVPVDDIEPLIEAFGAAQASADTGPVADARDLARCLAELEEKQRNCIVQSFVDGYTHEQLAEKLAVPLGTVKSWIRRGLLALKGCLS